MRRDAGSAFTNFPEDTMSQYTPEEAARIGQELYEREIRALVEEQNRGRYLVVDIETGDYEVDQEDLSATQRLLSRRPGAVIYGLRIGYPAAYRIGRRSETEGA